MWRYNSEQTPVLQVSKYVISFSLVLQIIPCSLELAVLIRGELVVGSFSVSTPESFSAIAGEHISFHKGAEKCILHLHRGFFTSFTQK